MSSIKFQVAGEPKPQGSKRAFVNKHTGKAMMLDVNRDAMKNWRAQVAMAAAEAKDFDGLWDGAVYVELDFRFGRPKSHYRTGSKAGWIKDSAPDNHTKKPDLDKLVRAVLDALTGVIFTDDSRVHAINATKSYGTPGLECLVSHVGVVKQLEYVGKTGSKDDEYPF